MKKIICLFALLGGLIISCKKTPTPTPTPTPAANKIYTPYNVAIKGGYRLDTITWLDTSKNSITGYKIYRDTLPNPTKLIKAIDSGTFKYIDTGLQIYKKYYYTISTYNKATESNKTNDYSVTTDTVKLGQIGGLHYVGFYFPVSTFHNLTHNITIKNLPTNWNGSTNNDGLYLQLYNAYINDTIQFYYGFQTQGSGKNFIFSRWNTRDTSNIIAPSGGQKVSAGYEGDFISVRRNYTWSAATYTIALNMDSSDTKGDWYSVWVTNNQTNNKDYMGSMRFERSTKSSGIKSGFGLWTELWAKDGNLPNTPLPNWNIVINKVIADGNLPTHCTAAYAENVYGAVRMPTNISTNVSLIFIDMGYNAMRLNNAGTLY